MAGRFPGKQHPKSSASSFREQILVAKAGEEPLSDLRAERDFFIFRKKGGTANNFLRPFVMIGSFFYANKKEEMHMEDNQIRCQLNMIRRR